MMQASILSLVTGLIALGLGIRGIAGLPFELGRNLLFIFLALSILTFLVSLWSRRRRLA